MKQFREEVREYYKPYYEKRDKDHQIDHVDSICDVALKINQGSDKKLVIKLIGKPLVRLVRLEKALP